jgi:hypothetical protein
MLYTEYKLAADKHLKTCLGIIEAIEKLKNFDSQSLILTKNKQATLHNLVYLGGYVLEAISTYSIYKHYGWNSNRNVMNKDDGFSSRCDFTFFSNDGYQYCVAGHNFQLNQFEVLKVPFSNAGIPIIDSSVIIDFELYSMFNAWEAEFRYHDANRSYPYLIGSRIPIDETNAIKFINMTKKIYTSLLQTVG